MTAAATSGLRRRTVLGAAGAMLPLALAARRPALADVSRSPDVVVFCDPTLRTALHHLGAMFLQANGAPVVVICAAAGIMAAQLERGERNDLIISLEPVVSGLVAGKLVEAEPAVGVWRNRVTIAGMAAVAGEAPAAAPERLAALLQDGAFGAPDPTVNAVFDTPALLGRLGLDQALAGRVVGEVDTGGIAFLLRERRVRLGLVLRTDARAEQFGEALSVPDEAYPPIRYATAQNKHVMSANASGFLSFLATPAARESLAASGLEVIA